MSSIVIEKIKYFINNTKNTEVKLIKNNIVIFFGVFASRITGFFRDIAFAYIFGVGPASDAFLAAFKLPNSFRRIFADGGLLISFVPVFAKENQKDKIQSVIFAGRILTLISIIVAVFIAIVIIFMPYVVKVINPGFFKNKATFFNAIKLSRISILFLYMASIGSLMCGILNAVGKFSYNAYNSVFFNIVLIAVSILCLTALKNGAEYHSIVISVGVVLGGSVAALFAWVGLMRNKIALRPQMPLFDQKEKEVLSGMLYSMFSFIKVFFDSVFASFFIGGISFLYYADRIINFPTSLIGYTLSASILPVLSKKFAINDFKEFTKIIFLSFKFIIILTIPVIFMLYGRAEDIIYFIYGNSKISTNDLQILSNILRISAFSVVFHIASKVITSAFFASSNQRMSFIINISNLTLNAILVFVLMKKVDIYAIFIANIFVAMMNFVAMFAYLYRQKIIVKLFQKDLAIDILIFSSIGLVAFILMNFLFDMNLNSKESIFFRLSFFMIFYCTFSGVAFFIRRFSVLSKSNTAS